MSSDWWSRNKHRYPSDWAAIANRVKTAAGWCCEACGAAHGPPPCVLTVHHLDHEPSNCADENLLACCQRCHLRLGFRIYTRATAIGYLRRRLALEDAARSLHRFDGNDVMSDVTHDRQAVLAHLAGLRARGYDLQPTASPDYFRIDGQLRSVRVLMLVPLETEA